MITELEVRGLRALRHVRASLSNFQVLVGANATGKSTFFDAVLLIRDVLTGGLEKAVFGDLRFGIPSRAADPRDLAWNRGTSRIELAITASLPDSVRKKIKDRYGLARYELAIETEPLGLASETLWLLKDAEQMPTRGSSEEVAEFFPQDAEPPETIVTPLQARKPPRWRKVVVRYPDSGNDAFYSETSGWSSSFRLGPRKSALASLPEDEEKFPAATWFKQMLMEGVYRLALNPDTMRLPCPPALQGGLFPDGSNLPWVVHEMEKQNPERIREWREHIATALDDISGMETHERAEDRSRYLVLKYNNGLAAPSWVLSDGTLRLLALTLLAYMTVRPSIILIEEPENGIHPRAIETVLQALSSVYDSQVFLATHSPIVLSQVKLDNLLCFGKTPSGAADVIPGREHPRLRTWKSALHLGDLFAMGVLG